MENQRLATSVVEAQNPSSLRVKFECGLNDNGKTILKSRTYSNFLVFLLYVQVNT